MAPMNLTGSWKEILARYFTQIPKTVGEAVWKLIFTVIMGGGILTGYMLYKNPGIVFGQPWDERSPTEILAIKPEIRESVYDLMNQFYLVHKPEGLMLVSWDTITEMRGLWVRPADEFPGKAGPHPMTPDMRVLGGPFLFGECAQTESLAKPGMIMVACPVNNEYDAWGYVAAIVEPEQAPQMLRLVEFLAHRVTRLIY